MFDVCCIKCIKKAVRCRGVAVAFVVSRSARWGAFLVQRVCSVQLQFAVGYLCLQKIVIGALAGETRNETAAATRLAFSKL